MTKVVRHSDFSLPDDNIENQPVFHFLTGKQITDPYLYHVHLALVAVEHAVMGHLQTAIQEGKVPILVYVHHLERDGPFCRAVVEATIETRKEPMHA